MKLIKKLVFLAANPTAEYEQIKNQITEITELGFDGLVFYTQNHFKENGNEQLDDKYIKSLSDIIIYAKSLETEFWICDDYAQNSENCIYEEYKTGLTKEAFNYISGFFADENAADATANYAALKTWCNKNDKMFMADIKNSETPLLQTNHGSSALQTLKEIALPGVKCFGRNTGNCYYPRIASSIARQFGNGSSFCTTFCGAGWGLDPYSFEKYLAWLIECGINTFLFNSAKTNLSFNNIIDWPASIPNHLPWKTVLPSIFERLERFAEIEFNRPRNILVITPMQAINENYPLVDTNNTAAQLSEKTVEICDRLHEIGRRFDITDETIFENNIDFSERGVNIGSAVYSTVLVTPGCSLSKKGMMYLERAKANGVRILNDIPTTDTEVIPLELIKNKLQEVVPMEIQQSDWSVSFPVQNRLLLIPERDGGNIILNFNASNNFSAEPVRLLISDEIENVSINNIIVTPENRDEHGVYYDITRNILSGKNTILLENCEYVYACLIGDFKVISKNGYLIFDERQVQTTYDFILENSTMESNPYLTECGYPFCTDFASAKKIIISKENILHPHVRINCINVSAMEVSFDGEKIGYVYGENNTLALPSIEAGQQHLIEVKAYSSAFNAYGPHFYYKGDSGFITPSQYFGIKNFADDNDAPNITTNRRMKLVLWSLPSHIDIVQKF